MYYAQENVFCVENEGQDQHEKEKVLFVDSEGLDQSLIIED